MVHIRATENTKINGKKKNPTGLSAVYQLSVEAFEVI